jgi:anaerobic selenocysteine-containing dehydrogenase
VGAKGEGRFTRISWEEALDTIATRLSDISREHGPESILPYSYGGTLGMLNGAGMDRRFFHRLGASRLDRTICATAGAAGLTAANGWRYGTEPEQFRLSKLIIAWGANIHGANIHLWPFIVEARRNGAKLVVIDPIRTRTAALADRHLALNPGSDLALALGMMHVIIGENLHDADYVERYTQGFDALRRKAAEYSPERAAGLTGIAAEDIVQLAREYATTRPAAIRVNYGVQRSEQGGAAVRTIAGLPALTGSWREAGGGLQLSTSQAFQFNRAGLEMPELQQRSPLGREARVVNMSLLGKALTEVDDPPVKAMVVYTRIPPPSRRIKAWCCAGCAATTCSLWCWSSSRPIRRITPTSCCPPLRFWSTPTCTSRTGIIICLWREPRCRLRARLAPTWMRSARWRCAWASTTRASAIPKTT